MSAEDASVSLRVDWPPAGEGRDPAGLEGLLAEAGRALAALPSARIVAALDGLSRSLLKRSCPLLSRYPEAGLPFLARLCREGEFSAMVADALDGLDCLDGFVAGSHVPGRERRAYPRGLVGHWLAGNVPTLGLLSLLAALMTKNASLVRLPSSADGLLSDLLAHFVGLGADHAILAASVAVVRYDHRHAAIAEAVSRMVDARIIWGGDESAAAVRSLPCKPACLDLVFPDRTSFVVVGRDYLEGERARAAVRLIAHDASVFEQRACASPHTVLLATDSNEVQEEFCGLLDEAMAEACRRIPKRAPSPMLASAVLNLRGQYDIFHQAWHPQGLEYTILSDDKVALGPPIGNRTLFVRRLPPLDELERIIPANVQTVGLAAEGEEYEFLSNTLGEAGVHRVCPLGAMTMFELPWDGLFVPHFLVRWTTRKAGSGA